MDLLELKELSDNHWEKQEAMYPETTGKYSYEAQCALIERLNINWLDPQVRHTLYRIIGQKLLRTQELDTIRLRMLNRIGITEEGVAGVVTADSGSCYGYHTQKKETYPHVAFWYTKQGLPFIQDLFGKCFKIITPIAEGTDFDSSIREYQLDVQEVRAVNYIGLTHKLKGERYETAQDKAKLAKEFWTELDKIVIKHTKK